MLSDDSKNIFEKRPEDETLDNCKIEFSENEKGFSSSFLVKHDTLSKIRKLKYLTYQGNFLC